MATLFGRLAISRASVLPMTWGASAPGTGRTAAAEPVASRMRSAPIFLPSTSIVCGPARRAAPWTSSTPALRNWNAIPLRSVSTVRAFHAIAFARS